MPPAIFARSISRPSTASALSPSAARGGLILVVVFAVAVSLGSSGGVGDVDADLTRLLRAMAIIKTGMAIAASAAIWWRLGSPVRGAWLLAYLTSVAAMASGPALIWSMAHLAAGAILLHGGLFAALVLLWRDKAVPQRLQTLVARRRRLAAMTAEKGKY